MGFFWETNFASIIFLARNHGGFICADKQVGDGLGGAKQDDGQKED